MTSPVSVTFLGGLGDIGRNCAVLGYEGRYVILDAGILFGGPDEPGVDAILPDFTWLDEIAEQVEAVVLTHGHEDHIGAITHLARRVQAPLYGSPFTMALVRHKLAEVGLVDRVDFHEVTDGDRRRVGPFEAEFLPITHSIPWGFATAFHTPQGVILHSGDYKLDPDPVDGRLSDLARIEELAADPGVRLLLADSTNAEDEGHSGTERSVGKALGELIADRPGRRIIVGCFSSHLHRIQQVCEAALATGRVVVPLGFSLRRNVEIARELGILTLDDDHLAEPDELDDLDPGEVLIATTGSQGEHMAGLALMARRDHRHVAISGRDSVIFSSTPIPGNEHAINRVIDGLARQGAEILTARMFPIHVSGHARRGEMTDLITAARPEAFVPVHGEFRHLRAQAGLAVELGVAPERAHVVTDGDRVLLTDGSEHIEREAVPGEHRYVHGRGDEVTAATIVERQILGREGVVVVTAVIDAERLEVIGGPSLVSRGWLDPERGADRLAEGEKLVLTELERVLHTGTVDRSEWTRILRRTAGRWVNASTGRRPMIVPHLIVV